MMAFVTMIVGVLCTGVAVSYLVNWIRVVCTNASRPPLPPGPEGLPLIGNINHFPPADVFQAKHWLKYKDIYGPISSITVMGQTMIVVNDAQLAVELCDKRSSKYSSRPRQVFAGEMIGWANVLGLVPYNDFFRIQRKITHQLIGTKSAANRFNSLQEAQVGHFLLHLLESPENFIDHVKINAGSVILKLTYGYTAESHKNDPLIDMSINALTMLSRAAVPGAQLVDTFPFLRNLPDWVPGTGFKKIARQRHRELLDVVEKPFAFVKHQIAHGTYQPSFVSQLLVHENSPEDNFVNKWAAGSLYGAGADTGMAETLCFLLMMVLHPDIQRSAQEEIDGVTGGQMRLPTFADRERMPYVSALTTKVLHLHPSVPMGVPHVSTEDDICDGYFIPKGSTLLLNIWHFTHDPNTYKDPMEFRPERFLGENAEPNPLQFVFGFGRRACPGRIVAQDILFLTIAQTLTCFNVTKKVGSDPVPSFGPGAISHVAPFDCVIKPRSPQHEELIKSIEKIHPWEESDGNTLKSIHVDW